MAPAKRVIILDGGVAIEYVATWSKQDLLLVLKNWIKEQESDNYLKQAATRVPED